MECDGGVKAASAAADFAGTTLGALAAAGAAAVTAAAVGFDDHILWTSKNVSASASTAIEASAARFNGRLVRALTDTVAAGLAVSGS